MNPESRSQSRPENSRFKWVLIAFTAIAGYFLITEHRAHVIEYLPVALLFGCMFLHKFMHGGHGQHGSRGQSREPSPGEETKGDKK